MRRSPGSTRCSYSSSGLERAEDTILNGSDERLFGRRLADFFTGRDPRGGNVDTTINPQVQQAAWDAMEDGCSGPCKGAVVALEPSTGKILAMVSSPSYDPNLLATHDVDEQSATWQQLRDNPDSPLLNRAISETYPPGSTFKVITTAAALQHGANENTPLTAAVANPIAGQHRNVGELRRVTCGGGPTTIPARGVRQVVQHGLRPARHQHRLPTRCGPPRSRSVWTPRPR